MKHFLIAILILLIVSGRAVSAQDNQADRAKQTLVKAGTVLTMNGQALKPGAVLVKDGKIVQVAASIEADDSMDVLDMGEASVLMPGLVDPYTQAGLGVAGSDELTNEITFDFKAIDSVDWETKELKRARFSGTTTMCVSPGRENVFSGIAAIIKTADGQNAIVNQDWALVANLCSDPTSRNRSRVRPDGIFVRQPTNRMGVVWILRKTFDKAKRNEGQEVQSESPVAQALAGQRPLMVFSRMSHDIQTVATLQDEFGYKPILVGGQEAYKVKELLAERKYPVILEGSPTGLLSGSERSELCWNNAGVLAEAGVQFAFSGDELLDQARFAVRHGLDRETALKAITSTPAEILGIADRVGKISSGFDADLLALTGDPLETTTSIRWVMVNGRMFQVDKE